MNYIPNKKLVELSYQPTFGLAICSCKIVNHDFQTLSKCQTASADDKKISKLFGHVALKCVFTTIPVKG